MRNAHNYNTELLKNMNLKGQPSYLHPVPELVEKGVVDAMVPAPESIGLDPTKVALETQFQVDYVTKRPVQAQGPTSVMPQQQQKKESLVEKVYSEIKKRTKEKYIKQKENEEIL